MKRVTNKELISVILVNIGLLAAAVYMWLIYDRRQTIIKSEEPIQNIRYWKLIAVVELHHPYS